MTQKHNARHWIFPLSVNDRSLTLAKVAGCEEADRSVSLVGADGDVGTADVHCQVGKVGKTCSIVDILHSWHSCCSLFSSLYLVGTVGFCLYKKLAQLVFVLITSISDKTAPPPRQLSTSCWSFT